MAMGEHQQPFQPSSSPNITIVVIALNQLLVRVREKSKYLNKYVVMTRSLIFINLIIIRRRLSWESMMKCTWWLEVFSKALI